MLLMTPWLASTVVAAIVTDVAAAGGTGDAEPRKSVPPVAVLSAAAI
jgi:hypothetical protein